MQTIRGRIHGHLPSACSVFIATYEDRKARMACAGELGRGERTFMRITGGILGSRKLRVPTADIRPTQDRVREALFSSLGERVVDARVLDLFAGTGALGLEAWSRGAASVCLVEHQRAVLPVLKDNVQQLCGAEPAVRVVAADVLRYLRQGMRGVQYDLILADPPYEHGGVGKGLTDILDLVAEHSYMAPGGLLVYEQAVRDGVAGAEGWALLREKTYGKTRLLFYERQPGDGESTHE